MRLAAVFRDLPPGLLSPEPGAVTAAA